MTTFMKMTTLCFVAATVVALSGCSSSIESNKAKTSSPIINGINVANVDIPAKRDLTIQVEEFNMAGQKDKIKTARQVALSPSFATSCETLKDLYQNSPGIVQCSIQKVAFTVKDGMPYTKMDVKIADSLKGDLQSDDLVSIVQVGGYMTLQDEVEAFHDEVRFPGLTEDQRKETIIEKKTTSESYPQAGESYVFFLMPSDNFAGAYTPVNDYECRYQLGGDGYYSRYVPEGSEQPKVNVEGKIQSADSFTYEWLKEQVKSTS